MIIYKKILFVVLFIASSAQAHHSDAGINMQSITAFEGTVVEFNWRNPHVYIIIETNDALGETVRWSIQASSVSVSLRSGWTPDFLEPGDRVTARIHPKQDGQAYGVLESIEKADGTKLFSNLKFLMVARRRTVLVANGLRTDLPTPIIQVATTACLSPCYQSMKKRSKPPRI